MRRFLIRQYHFEMKALFHPLSDIVETFASISCECWHKKRYILCDFSHIFYQRTGICRHDSVFLFCMTDALQKNSSVKSCRKGQRHKKIFSGNALIIAAAVFIPPWPCRSASAARVPAKWRVHAGKRRRSARGRGRCHVKAGKPRPSPMNRISRRFRTCPGLRSCPKAPRTGSNS